MTESLAPLSPLSPTALKAHVVTLLEQDGTIPVGHQGALVAVVNLDHVQITIATRVGDSWTVQLTARKQWQGDAKIEGTIKTTW
jgi:hypothetical protein